jgi:hypothetical protein
MSSKRIYHFLGGILGKYVGHSVEHDDGTTDHYVNTGSIIPGEEYVGSSKGERASGGSGGGGGGDIPGGGFLLIILSPFLLLLGLIALSVVVYVGPFYWLFRKYFGKKTATADANERPRFVGVGWVILAFFIILIGLLYAIFLIGAFISAPTLIFPPGEKPAELILFWLQISWGVCLLLFALDIVRKNPVGGVVGVFVVFGGLWAFGNFFVFRNQLGIIPQIRSAIRSAASKTGGSRDSGDQNTDMPQISNISAVLPQQLQKITIQGHGFGTRPPYTGDSDFLQVSDLTRNWDGGWSKDPGTDKVGLEVTSWTDTKIVIEGFTGEYGAGQWSLGEGDNIRFRVWNPQTGQGPAVYASVVAPVPSVAPPEHEAKGTQPGPSVKERTDAIWMGGQYGLGTERVFGGNAAVFSAASSSRLEYGPYLSNEGTLELWIKVNHGYRYDNFQFKDNLEEAVIFSSDCEGGDVTWPGTTKLSVKANGDITLWMATSKYNQPPAQATVARGTSFRFGQWHAIGISYGSQGQWIMLDGNVVVASPSFKQTLGRAGSHQQPLDVPTIGETASHFWAHHRYEGGFDGVLAGVRISPHQKDWYLALIQPSN